LQATRPRTVGLVDFAVALVELGAIPELTSPQTAYLEALDGKQPAPPPAVLATFAKAGSRRFLRTLVAAHTIANGHHATLIHDAGETTALAIIDDVLELATLYRGGHVATPLGELSVRAPAGETT
jgi:hypothetical protein